jgi:hypothetical protein
LVTVRSDSFEDVEGEEKYLHKGVPVKRIIPQRQVEEVVIPSVREARKFIRMAPDLRTWVPVQAEQEFTFGDKANTSLVSKANTTDNDLVDAELSPEEMTLCEWATGRHFQRWCGTYYRAHPLDVEAAVCALCVWFHD